jgi:hypothetical protein
MYLETTISGDSVQDVAAEVVDAMRLGQELYQSIDAEKDPLPKLTDLVAKYRKPSQP